MYFCKASNSKGRSGLVPACQGALDALKRLGDGEQLCVEFIRPRSLKWHRLYFAVCKMIGDNQDPRRDVDSIDMELRILSGHYEVMHVDSREVRVPKRIAFNRLTHDQWSELWPSIDLAIRERFGEEYLQEVGAA
jgi:hypothetical protein